MADLIGGLHLVRTGEVLRLGADETGLTDVQFDISAAGLLTLTPTSGERIKFATDVQVADDLVIDDTLTVTGVSLFTGSAGFGAAASAAVRVLLAAGSASLAPLSFTSGTLLTTPVAGRVEFLTDAYYATISTGAVRKKILLSPTDAVGALTNDGAGVLSWAAAGAAAAGTLTGMTLAANVVTSSLTTVGTLTGLNVAAGGVSLFGHTAAQTVQPAVTPNTQVIGTNGLSSAAVGFVSFQASAAGPRFAFAHSRGASIGTHTVLNANDQLGGFDFSGSDGTVFQQNAFFRVYAAALHTSTSMPAYMQWAVAPTGSINATKLMRYAEDGHLYMGAETALDADLYRLGTNLLATTNAFIAGGRLVSTNATDGVQVQSGAMLHWDGSVAGDTYDLESSANVRDMYVGGVNTFRSTATAITLTATVTGTSSFTSGAPNGGTAKPWKFGNIITGQVGLVVIATQYVELDVNGTLYKLATV